ncbi:MAG: hypothetical protein ACPLXA_04785 [Moorellaceae bacterium]
MNFLLPFTVRPPVSSACSSYNDGLCASLLFLSWRRIHHARNMGKPLRGDETYGTTEVEGRELGI